jgi:hypothetical protein
VANAGASARSRRRAWRYCPTCKEASEFVRSERFRVNAWKAPVIERRPVSQLSSALLEAFA